MSENAPSGDPLPVQAWPRLRARLFRAYFLAARPLTLGVRGVIHDSKEGSVFLVRHTYVPGWQFPGGGVEAGETAIEALKRELGEEGNITLTGRPVLCSLHFNRRASRRDHVVVYLVEAFRQFAPKRPDREIAQAGFFPLAQLPEGTTPATRRRIDEIFGGAPISEDW